MNAAFPRGRIRALPPMAAAPERGVDAASPWPDHRPTVSPFPSARSSGLKAALRGQFQDAPLPRRAGGFLLLDCLMYIALFALILGLAFTAFYRTLDNTKRLHRAANDIVRALKAGELWRADVRSATTPQLVTSPKETVLLLPQKNGEVRYAFREGAIFRQAATNAAWLAFLPDVENSRMETDQRREVRSWDFWLREGSTCSLRSSGIRRCSCCGSACGWESA